MNSATCITGALSNEENQFLEESITAKVKDFTSIQVNIEENHDRIRLLEDHQQLVQDELHVIQRLLAACRTEETNQRSQMNIDNAEMKRLERLIDQFDVDFQRYNKRKNDFQEEIDQIHRQISKIEQATQTERETMEKCIEIMKKRDEETFSLMKYTRQDDLRIKELTTELERYSQHSRRLKRAIDEELIEYSGLETSLEKIASQFRRSHQHRQQLLYRWETILNQMQDKDENINRFAQKLIEMKTFVRTKEHEFNEQKHFFEREQKNNTLLNKFIDLTNRKLTKLKAQQQISKERQESGERDILSLKSVLLNTQNQIQRERIFISDIQSTIQTKQAQLTKLRQHHAELLDRKSFILNSKYSIEEKLSKLDQSLEHDQNYHDYLHVQQSKFIEQLFHLNNELSQIRQREKQYQLENSSSQNQLEYLRNQLLKFDQQLFQQQEIIYHQDFHRQTIDRQLNQLIGKKTKEKFSTSDDKLRLIQQEFLKKKSHYDQLQQQMKILHEDIRLTKHQCQQFINEKNQWNNQIIQFDLHEILTEKIIKKLTREKEDYLVEENLLQIELKRLKTLLHNSSEVNCNLEQQQIEFQKTIKERRMEIQTNTHLFRIRFNDERTKKQTISTELALRITKIEKLKHRYETIAMGLDGNQSEKENARNQAQSIIQTALMKEDLFQQGDQLESLIVKAEAELRALENTVAILKWNNADVKKNFEKLNPSSMEMCEMKELEEHVRAMTEQVKIRRKLLNNQQSMDDVSRQSFHSNEEFHEKQRIEMQLEEEIEQYHTKINRADQLIKRFQRNSGEMDENEIDVDIRLLRETIDKLEQQLTSIYSSERDHSNMNLLSNFIVNHVQISIDNSKKSL